MFICRITLNYYENNVINRQLITKNNIFLVEASLKRLSWSGNTVPDKIFKEGGALLDKKINKRPSPHVTVIKSHMRTFHADHLSACPHVKNARRFHPSFDNELSLCTFSAIIIGEYVSEASDWLTNQRAEFRILHYPLILSEAYGSFRDSVRSLHGLAVWRWKRSTHARRSWFPRNAIYRGGITFCETTLRSEAAVPQSTQPSSSQ